MHPDLVHSPGQVICDHSITRTVQTDMTSLHHYSHCVNVRKSFLCVYNTSCRRDRRAPIALFFLPVLKFYVFWDGDVSKELQKTVIELNVQETTCLMGASVIG